MLKNSDKIAGSPEYTGTDVLVKFVESKVPTVRAMSPKFTVDRQRKVLVLTNIALIFFCAVVFLHHFPVKFTAQ